MTAIVIPPGLPKRMPLLALLAANAISLIGSTSTAVAIPWFVLQTTGSAAKTGLAGACVILPAFVMGIFGGTLVDRLQFKWVSVAEDIVSGLAIAAIPLLYHTVGLVFWQLLALVFLGSLLAVPGVTARRALVPELGAFAGVRLERVNAAFEGNSYLASVVGPTLAGLLIARWGVGQVPWLDAASFALSAALVATAVPALMVGVPSAMRSGYLREIAAGLRFIRHDPLLLALAVGLGVANFFGLNPLFAVMLPVYASRNFGSAAALGALITGQGLGALLGAIVFGAIGHRLPRRPIWMAGFLVGPLRLWTMVLSPPLPVLAAVLLLGGIVSGAFNPLLNTIRHERVPVALRGRIFGTFSAIASVAAPLGVALAGAFVDGVGFAVTVVGMAIGASLVGLGMVTLPPLSDTAGTQRSSRL